MNRPKRPQNSLRNENLSAAGEGMRGQSEAKKAVRKAPARKRPEAENLNPEQKSPRKAPATKVPQPANSGGGESGAKKSRKRGRGKKAVNIASNPSVNPPSSRQQDRRMTPSDWAHLSVEEELKRRGLKLPPGMRPEDLELPSYHTVVVERQDAPPRRAPETPSRPASGAKRPEAREKRPEAREKRPESREKRPETAAKRPETREKRPENRLEKPEKPVRRPEAPAVKRPAQQKEVLREDAGVDSRRVKRPQPVREMPAERDVAPKKIGTAKKAPVAKKAPPKKPEPAVKAPEAKKPAVEKVSHVEKSPVKKAPVAKKPVEVQKPAEKPVKKAPQPAKKELPVVAKKPVVKAAPVVPQAPKAVPAKAEAGRVRKAISPEFAKFGLSREVLYGLADAEYLEPTDIQKALVPVALEGHDLMGQSQTGTGKTAAFAIPILETIKFEENTFDPQALVLVPTRELAVQVKDEIRKLSEYTDFEILAVYGGTPVPPQVQTLRQGVDIVVGTPGRVLDHIKRGSLKLGKLKFVVLDEADRMLDVGFRPDIEKILRQCPQSRQTMLLTATLSSDVRYLARNFMREPVIIDCSPKDLAGETIEQFYFTVDPELKFDLLERLLEREEPRQAIIFCRTKRGTEKIFRRLQKHWKSVGVIHGDLQQRQRDRVMVGFRSGKTQYLVATDVVGRGIDVTNISHIINYDIPSFCDDYVHRVGRTGRMGREGVAYTFVTPEEGNELTKIEVRINRLLQRDEIPGFSSVASVSRPVVDNPDNGDNGDDVDDSGEKEPKKPAPHSRRRKIRRAL